MRLDLKIDRDLAFGQALSIYHIIKKELLKFSEEQLSLAQETTPEELDDIALHWEFIQT